VELPILLTVIVSVIIFVLIFSEKVHRTIAVWAGSILLGIIGRHYGFLTEEKMLSYIDFNVIGLLLGMMTIASMLEISGFFEFTAIKLAKIAKGEPWILLVMLGTGNTIISLFIDNVTSIILFAPITITICDRIGISPIPILMAEALLADTGGVGTMVGDPPNVMIASAAGFSFNSFIIRLGPVVCIAWGVSLLYLLFHYRKWIGTAPQGIEDLISMDEWGYVKNKQMMYKTIGVLVFTILMYVTNDYLFHLNVATVALTGAGIGLIINLPDVYDVLGKIEWPSLLFFAGLYIVVGTLEEVGVLAQIGYWMADIAASDTTLAIIIFIWVSAISSAFVDNIPFTAAMIPIIAEMGNYGLPTNLLYWTLALGVGFGGNGTPIGSTANVITISIAERNGHPITLREWIKAGTPVMLLTCLIGMLFVLIFRDYYMGP
jgi:Na+/H+ antiporter NhaD/arsenite permease-like protein